MVSSPRHEFDYVEKRSCLRAQCNCLCGTGSCRCCCRCFPPIRESTVTRVVYIFLLVFTLVIMALFMSSEIQNEIIQLFPDTFSICEWLGAGSTCHAGRLMGYLAVYRIGFAVTLFHLLLMLFTCGVKSSKDCRASLHNGLWLYKIMLLAFLLIAAFLIPDYEDYFINAWMYFSMTAAAAFIVIQLILLVFMVHKWTDRIQKRVDDGSSPILWLAVIAPGLSILIFVASGTGICFLYIYFASEEGCHKNQWFILLNAFGCFVVSVVTVVRKDSKPASLRLLHASMITFYVTYLTWVAISSAPRRFQRYARPTQPVYRAGTEYRPRFTSSFYQDYYCGPSGDEEIWADRVIPYVSFVITLSTVIFGSIGMSEHEKCNSLRLPGCPPPPPPENNVYIGNEESCEAPIPERDDSGGQVVVRNEKTSLVYSYSLFHAMMLMACLLMMVHLTHWHTPTRATLMTFGRSWASVWIKIASSWVCLLFYFVTVLCPSVLPREIPTGVKLREAVSVVEVNGHAVESDACSFSEEAIPLNIIRRPIVMGTHMETTV